MRRRKVAFSSDLRQRALKRAGLAVALALALLLAVLWFGDSDHLPPPVTTEQPNTPDAGMPLLPVPDMAVQAPNEPAETPAPTTVEATEPTPSAIQGQEAGVTPNTATSTTLPQEANAPAQPQKAAKTHEKPVSLPDGYFIQLGVFNDTENVGRVFENVTALGMSAHIQSHVVVGPFRNKHEAEAARNRLKDIAEGTVLPPKKTAKPSGKPKAKSTSRQRAK